MALDPRTLFQCEPSGNDFGSENLEFEPIRRLAIRNREGISAFSSTQLNSFQNSNNSYARQELQKIYEFFHSWLQPEKHSKDEIISQLVLEQFVISGHCNDRSTLKEKWESSGRNLEKLMENMTDDCMKEPVLVHVCMQGQEALFSENMPLKEVIVHLTKQLSARTLTEENMEVPFQTAHDTPLETGQGQDDKECGCNISWKTTQVNGSTSQGNQMSSLLIIQEENSPRPEDEDVFCENPHNLRRAGMGISRSQEGPLKGSFYQDVPMEVGTGFLSKPDQSAPESVPVNQRSEGNSTYGVQQERSPEAPKSYKCEECPKIFKYLCHLLAHQRRHRNERPFVCSECHKGFFQTSDLRVHQIIHKGERPFACTTCEKSFSHKTNLRAHVRIHTGEKPYTCSLCHRSYRQSSTYHRHLKMHEKIPLKNVPSTPEAS
ncbi:zinc finger and SCAN domain-containing protein 4 [Otolemur garnettii]|uniref:zinc finger and SCAN domain-containing protein 4 n=1 Tax=Otolemur garnettii TaxID=30611 RepID=UPI00064467B0|nr:zinc finger and SCAN domain-containing protein 4 [Otolemur garnettii]